jgi:hypothetical protein
MSLPVIKSPASERGVTEILQLLSTGHRERSVAISLCDRLRLCIDRHTHTTLTMVRQRMLILYLS